MSANPYEPSRVPAPLQVALPQIGLPYEIRFDLTVEDLVAYNLHFLRGAYRWLGYVFFAIAVIPAGAAVGLYLTLASDDLESVGIFILFCIVLCIVLVAVGVQSLIWGVPTIGSGWLIRNLLTRGDTSTLIGPYELRLEEHAILERAPKSEHRFAISAVQKIVVARELLLLYVSPIQAFIIPRRAFGDPREVESLVELLERLTKVKAIRE